MACVTSKVDVSRTENAVTTIAVVGRVVAHAKHSLDNHQQRKIKIGLEISEARLQSALLPAALPLLLHARGDRHLLLE